MRNPRKYLFLHLPSRYSTWDTSPLILMISEVAHVSSSYTTVSQWRYKMLMRNRYTMATNLVLGESRSLVPNGQGVMSTSNGGRGSEYAEVNAKLPTEFESSKRFSDKCGEDTGDKSVWRSLNLILDICSFTRGESSVFVPKHCTF